MSFQIDENTLVRYCEEPGVTEARIPKNVKIIGQQAFSGCKHLKRVIIPNTVTEIRDGAFMGCESLEELTLPEGIERTGFGMLIGCVSLSRLNVPKGYGGIYYEDISDTKLFKENKDPLMIIGTSLIKCSKETVDAQIPEGVTKISSFAFDECDKLKRVTIPKSVTVIGNCAFSGCSGLEEINVAEGFDKLSVNDVRETKWYKDQKGDFVILGGVLLEYRGKGESAAVPEGVVWIQRDAFKGCKGLREIALPKTLCMSGFDIREITHY